MPLLMLDTGDGRAAVPDALSRATPGFLPAIGSGSLAKLVGLADQAIVSGGMFLATVAVGRWSNAHELGAYTIATSVAFSVISLQRALIVLPFMVRRTREEREGLAVGRHALAENGALSAATLCILLVCALGFQAFGSERDFTLLTLALSWLVPCMLLREFARQFAFARLRILQALLTDASALVLLAPLVIWLGMTGRLSAANACLAGGVAFGAAGLGWLLLNRNVFRAPRRRFWKEARENWVLGRWLLAGQIANTVQAFVASWVLAITGGPAAAGVYAACLTLVGVANPVINGSSNVLMPRMALILRDEGLLGLRQRAFRDAALLGAAMLGFCVVIVCSWRTVAIVIYGSSTYAGQGHTVIVLSLGLLATALGIPPSNALTCIERPRALFLASAMAAAANTILALCLVRELGVVGAAYGFLGGSLVGNMGRWTVFLALSGGWPGRSPSGQVGAVLRELDDPHCKRHWKIDILGHGAQAMIFAAHADAPNPSSMFAVKIYKPGTGRDLALAQFDALRRIREAIAGHRLEGWQLTAPEPIRLCETPLALVMTMKPGRSLLRQLEDETLLGRDEMESAARALARGMIAIWSAGTSHGDLNLDNVLCDAPSRTLTILDPGIPTQLAARQVALHAWGAPSRDLAYLLYETLTTLRRSLGHRGAEKRKQRFIILVLQTVLREIPGADGRQRLLDGIQGCAQFHLATLEGTWTPRGLWRHALRRIASYRVTHVVQTLRADLRGGPEIGT